MAMESQRGYLILADITGYTAYLAGVELTHAQEVLAELLEGIVGRFQPALILSKLEGDAVFAYTPPERLSRDEAILEIIEATYLAFRDQVEGILRRTTCQCNACRSIPDLDLKFIVHFGEYVPQKVAGVVELVGSDVNLAHRLLKNHVAEATGWRAYILLTEAALQRMNLQLERLHEQQEQYDHLGDVMTYGIDLHRRYQEMVEARRVQVAPESADFVITRLLAAPPVVVWDWLNDIQKRLMWEQFDDIRPFARPAGRMGAGARNHCAHGKNVITETVLDWRPFDYYTVEYPMGVQTRYLQAGPDGTQLTQCLSLKMPLPPALRRVVARFMARQTKVDRQLDTLVRLIAEDSDN
jgi:hypothetical protein